MTEGQTIKYKGKPHTVVKVYEGTVTLKCQVCGSRPFTVSKSQLPA